MNGWIKMYRQIQTNWIWDSTEPYDKRSAWVYLLLNANYENSSKSVNGEIVNLEKGQIFVSVRTLAQKWKWSESKTYSFIKRLESERMVKVIRKKNGTLLAIENYGFYQDSENTEKTLTKRRGNTEETPKKHQQNTEETLTKHNIRSNNKEDKKERNNNTAKEHEREAEELFSRLWQLYPKKRGKGQVSMSRKLKLRKIGYDKLAEAIDAYKKELLQKNTSEEYTMNGSTFFNSGYIDFLPESNCKDGPQKSLYSEEDVERLKQLGIDID